jgi:hypothetical protein
MAAGSTLILPAAWRAADPPEGEPELTNIDQRQAREPRPGTANKWSGSHVRSQWWCARAGRRSGDPWSRAL